MVQHVPGRQEDNRHDPYRSRDPQRTPDAKPAKQIGVIAKAGVDRTAVGVHHGHAAQQQHHHQGSDEGLHAAFRHNHPGDCADRGTQCEGSSDRHQRINLNANNRRCHRTGERQQGADGQVDPRGQYNQRHPYRHDGVNGGLLQDIEQVIDGKKLGLMVDTTAISTSRAISDFAPSATLS